MNKAFITIYIVYSVILLLFGNSLVSLIYISILAFNIMYLFNVKFYINDKLRNTFIYYIFVYGLIFDLYLFKPLGETSLLFLIPFIVLYFYSGLRLRLVLYFLSSFIFNMLLLIYLIGFNSVMRIYSNYLIIIFILILIILDSIVIKFFIRSNKNSKNTYTLDI
jgi:hypothetical protein